MQSAGTAAVSSAGRFPGAARKFQRWAVYTAVGAQKGTKWAHLVFAKEMVKQEEMEEATAIDRGITCMLHPE